MDEVTVLTPKGEARGRYKCHIEGPWALIPFESLDEYDSIRVSRHDVLRRELATGEFEDRPIVGIAIEGTIVSLALRILAPKPITKAKYDAPFINFAGIELRAGTEFIGGRDSGFYDSEGLIVEATHVGGDPKEFEDWAYYVIGRSSFGKEAPQWILLDNIGHPTAGPSSLLSFETPKSKTIDALIADGDKELLDYLLSHPKAIGSLTGKQLEGVMGAIYRNLGFEVEPVGRWNQADGGVDLIAISRTDASTEFRLAIQCKASKNKISAKPIRELAGVLDKFKAHQGIVATTSKFTGPARQETEGHMWR